MALNRKNEKPLRSWEKGKWNEAQYCRERVTHLGITKTSTLLGVHEVSECWGLVKQSKR